MNLGIENIKKVFKAIIDVSEQIVIALSDGLQVQDGFVLITEWSDIKGVYENFPAAWDEFKDLDTQEASEIVEFIAGEFDIESDDAELKVEQGFRLVSRAYIQYESTKTLFLDVRDYVNSLKKAA